MTSSSSSISTTSACSSTWALFGEKLTDEGTFRTKFAQILYFLFGARVPATGATLMRGLIGTPRAWASRAAKSF